MEKRSGDVWFLVMKKSLIWTALTAEITIFMTWEKKNNVWVVDKWAEVVLWYGPGYHGNTNINFLFNFWFNLYKQSKVYRTNRRSVK